MNVTTLKILLLIAFHISTGVLLDSVKGRNRFSIDYCNRPTVSGDQHSASTLLQPFQRIRRRMPVCVCCRTGNNSQFRSDDFQKLCYVALHMCQSFKSFCTFASNHFLPPRTLHFQGLICAQPHLPAVHRQIRQWTDKSLPLKPFRYFRTEAVPCIHKYRLHWWYHKADRNFV